LGTTSDIGSNFCPRKYFFWRKSLTDSVFAEALLFVVRGWRDSVVAVSKGQGYAGSKFNIALFAGENREQ